MSLDDAKEQAQLLGVKYSLLSIESMFEATLATLKNEFAGRPPDALVPRGGDPPYPPMSARAGPIAKTAILSGPLGQTGP